MPGGAAGQCCLQNDTYPVETTVAYAKAAVRAVLRDYHGNPSQVVLLGHSRGSIATQAIGGADSEIASMWAGVAAASHWDGGESWAYSRFNGGTAGAVQRARRLAAVPKFLTGECDLQTRLAYDWLRDVARVDMRRVTAVPTGFRDHTGFWVLRPDPGGARAALRRWVAAVLNVSVSVEG